ncbi:MAG: MFS transporter [Betaproteobacteria bacterium]|nr:MFS transporter [Betaproteobacteria bacterium]
MAEARAASGGWLLLHVSLPFLAGYYLSYTYRAINALLGPVLAAEFGLSAGTLGLLTSVYFLAFGLFQIPLGVLLDRYDPRRVDAALLLIAAAGALVFASADSPGALLAGRALVGLGVSGCLMSAFQAFVLWYPADRIAFMNGVAFSAGALGAMTATVPLELALRAFGWREIFVALALATVAVAAVLYCFVPERRQERKTETLAVQLAGVAAILRDPAFWRVGIALCTSQAATVALLTLWMATWLRDVAGFSRVEVAQALLAVNIALIAGYLAYGRAADAIARRRRSTLPLFAGGIACASACLALITFGATAWTLLTWSLFIFFGAVSSVAYPMLSRRYPRAMAGRANTCMNIFTFMGTFLGQWGAGLILNRWAPTATGYDPAAYFYAFGALWLAQFAGLLWLLAGRRLLSAAPATA